MSTSAVDLPANATATQAAALACFLRCAPGRAAASTSADIHSDAAAEEKKLKEKKRGREVYFAKMKSVLMKWESGNNEFIGSGDGIYIR